MVALLDVNVLIALFDPEHVHHEPAHSWFADHRSRGWATTPITENGVVRILSSPAYHSVSMSASDALAHLRSLCSSGDHEFWPSDVSLVAAGVLTAGALVTHRQVTDLYLLALATARYGCLVTFDTSIPHAVVHGATRDHLLVIGA